MHTHTPVQVSGRVLFHAHAGRHALGFLLGLRCSVLVAEALHVSLAAAMDVSWQS